MQRSTEIAGKTSMVFSMDVSLYFLSSQIVDEKETRKQQVKQTRGHLYSITSPERNAKNKQTYPEVLALHKEQMIVVSCVAKKNKSRRKSNDNGVSHSLTST